MNITNWNDTPNAFRVETYPSRTIGHLNNLAVAAGFFLILPKQTNAAAPVPVSTVWSVGTFPFLSFAIGTDVDCTLTVELFDEAGANPAPWRTYLIEAAHRNTLAGLFIPAMGLRFIMWNSSGVAIANLSGFIVLSGSA